MLFFQISHYYFVPKTALILNVVFLRQASCVCASLSLVNEL